MTPYEQLLYDTNLAYTRYNLSKKLDSSVLTKIQLKPKLKLSNITLLELTSTRVTDDMDKSESESETEELKFDTALARKQHYFNLFKKTVEERGGTCLATINDYVDVHNRLEAKCTNGHVFTITPNNLKFGKWCAECNINLGELITTAALEHIFQLPFKKIRPDWLKNDQGNKLELDAFNESLMLAAEYNGIQHYKFIPHFYKTLEEFIKRQIDDALKVTVCPKYNVNLIVVPYTIKHKDIYNYVLEQCIKLGYKMSQSTEPFNMNACYERSSQCHTAKRMIEERGGTFLGIVTDDIIKFMCEYGHERTTNIKNILKNKWCSTCSHTAPRASRSDDAKVSLSATMKTLFQTEKGKELIRKRAEKLKTINQTEEGQRKRLETNEKIRNTRAKNREIACEKARKEINDRGEKPCTCAGSCEKTKPLSEFNKNNQALDGYNNICRSCYNIRYPRKSQAK